MFGPGMSYSDIAGHVQELYGISLSTATLSTITDQLIDEGKATRLNSPNAWQARPACGRQAVGADRPAQPGRQRHPDRLGGWPDGLS